MYLVKFKVLFLSQSFLPISPIREYWTITHVHVPPATMSGLLFRGLLLALNHRSLYGDYIPCGAGEGLLVRLKGEGAEWIVARKEEVVDGFRPPYVEYHFKAVVLGAYDPRTLVGEPPLWGHIEKYWNNLKYVDPREENLFAPFKVGIKTWHFAAMDGTWRYMTYDVVKVRFDFPLSDLYGFMLVDDDSVLALVSWLSRGWFIDKTRLKNLVAVKVEEVATQVKAVEEAKSLRVLPSIARPRSPSYTFTSALLSKDALRGRRRDVSVEKGLLYVENPKDVDPGKKLLFRGGDGTVYAVDESWLDYLELAGVVGSDPGG